jgi:hypothetical protein
MRTDRDIMDRYNYNTGTGCCIFFGIGGLVAVAFLVYWLSNL